MQIETGDITPMISMPIDSRMLDSIRIGWGISSIGWWVRVSTIRHLGRIGVGRYREYLKDARPSSTLQKENNV